MRSTSEWTRTPERRTWRSSSPLSASQPQPSSKLYRSSAEARTETATSDVSWESLKKEVTVAVESELQSSVTEFEFSQEEYRQLQYQEALSLPLGLSVSPGTGNGPAAKEGLRVRSSCHVLLWIHLYLSYDEYLSSEEETPIAE
ncbi:hypothetical protein KUCAC02_032238, partial [Chaenocephalus aceratus]